MSTDVKDALRLLVAQMEAHLDAVIVAGGEDSDAVANRKEAVAQAFERYEDALDLEFGEALPLVVFDEIDIDDEDLDDDEGDDDDLDDDIDDDLEEIDPHAVEDEDDMDDDLDEFELS